jgi:ParB-like chromosome segregation protein Spo0J
MPVAAKRHHKAETPFVVELCPIEQVKPYDKNPRIIPETAIVSVARSIAEFGFRQPIVVDDDNIIIVGTTRFKAAQYLKLRQVPIHRVSGLTPEQVRAYRIADNKVHEGTSWDQQLLLSELDELHLDGVDLELTGFNLEELQKLQVGPDFVPPEGLDAPADASHLDTTVNYRCPHCKQVFPLKELERVR